MKLIATERFKKEYANFPKNIQEKVDKKLKLLAQNLKHPSLRVKKIKGTLGIWEARISKKYRLTFKVTLDVLILRAIGEHDKTLKLHNKTQSTKKTKFPRHNNIKKTQIHVKYASK